MPGLCNYASLFSGFATSTIVVLSLGLLSVSSAISQQTAESPLTSVQRGQKLFGQACAFCHGVDATGARGPDLVRSPLVAHDLKGELIGEVIRNGRPDKGMPAMPSTDDQVSDIAAYVHARAKEALESSGVPNAYPVEKLLTGSAEKGKAFFEGPGGCKNCHSPTGDLAGVSRKYPPIELQAHMLYPESQPVTATVSLASGEQIKGVVSHLDDFVVSIRIGDKTGWYRSFLRKDVKLELKDPLAEHRELLPKLTPADLHNLFAYINTLK